MVISQTILKKAARIQRLVQNGCVDENIHIWLSDVYMNDLQNEIIVSHPLSAEGIERIILKTLSLIYGVPETDERTLWFLKERDAEKNLMDVLTRPRLLKKELTKAERLALASFSEISGIKYDLLTKDDLRGFMTNTTQNIMRSVYMTSEGIEDPFLIKDKHPWEIFENESVRKAYRSLRGIVGGAAMNKSADEFLADWDETIESVVIKRRLTADERREQLKINAQIQAMWKKRKAELNDKSDIVWPEKAPAVSSDAEIEMFEADQLNRLRIENAILRSGLARMDGRMTILGQELRAVYRRMRRAERNLIDEQNRSADAKMAWEQALTAEKQKTADERLRADRAEDEAAVLAEQIAELERSLHVHQKNSQGTKKETTLKIKELKKQLADAKMAWEQALTAEKQKTADERLRADRAEDEAAVLAEQIAELERSLHVHQKNNQSTKKETTLKIKELKKQVEETKTALREQKVGSLQLRKKIAELQGQVYDLTVSLKRQKMRLKMQENNQSKNKLETTWTPMAEPVKDNPKTVKIPATEPVAQSYAEEVEARRLKNEAEKAKRAAEERMAENFVLSAELKPYYYRYHRTVAKVGGYLESVNEKYNQYLFVKYWNKSLNEIADEQIPDVSPEERINWITEQVDHLADTGAGQDRDVSPAEAQQHVSESVGNVILHYHGKMKQNQFKRMLIPLFVLASLATVGYLTGKAFAKDNKEAPVATPIVATNAVETVVVDKPASETTKAVQVSEKTTENKQVVPNTKVVGGGLVNVTFNNATLNFYSGVASQQENHHVQEKTERCLTLQPLPANNARYVFSDDLSFRVVGNARLPSRKAALLVRNTAAKSMIMLLRDGLSIEQAAREITASNVQSIRGPRITLHDMRGATIAQFSVNDAAKFLYFTNGVTQNLADNLKGVPPAMAVKWLEAFGGTLSYTTQQLEQMLSAAPQEQVVTVVAEWKKGIQAELTANPKQSETTATLKALKDVRENNPSALYLPSLYALAQTEGMNVPVHAPETVATQHKPLPVQQNTHER